MVGHPGFNWSLDPSLTWEQHRAEVSLLHHPSLTHLVVPSRDAVQALILFQKVYGLAQKAEEKVTQSLVKQYGRNLASPEQPRELVGNALPKEGPRALPEEVNRNVKVFLQNHSKFSIL